MIIERSVTIPKPIQKVWDKIMDMESTIRCMPGVKSVEAIDDKTYHIKIDQKVSFIPVRFKAVLKVTNLQPPTHLEIFADGTALGGLGKGFQTTIVDLIPLSENEVKVIYKGDISLSGRIGTFGQRVLGGKVDKMAEEFIGNFLNKLSEDFGEPIEGEG